jgi:hypothetical protein
MSFLWLGKSKQEACVLDFVVINQLSTLSVKYAIVEDFLNSSVRSPSTSTKDSYSYLRGIHEVARPVKVCEMTFSWSAQVVHQKKVTRLDIIQFLKYFSSGTAAYVL